jgi:hypothetical protein
MFVLIALLLAGLFQAPQTDRQTIWSGVYTAEQAARGEVQFQMQCAECHAGDLDPRTTTSRLVGERFMDRWREEKVSYLFNFVSTSMPRRAPASLTEAVYLDIISYLMRTNNFPAGKEPLTKAATETIQFERKEGSQPLPGNTLIQLVGCLTVDPDETWFVTNATEPVRTRRPDATAEEISAAQANPLGTKRFRLANFDYVGRAFEPLDNLERKIYVKGTLIRQPNRDRINITAIKVVGAACEP